jgi:hypothetical protein
MTAIEPEIPEPEVECRYVRDIYGELVSKAIGPNRHMQGKEPRRPVRCLDLVKPRQEVLLNIQSIPSGMTQISDMPIKDLLLVLGKSVLDGDRTSPRIA